MNTREKVLKEALNCVNGEREKQYGNPEDNFRRIADLWSVYLTSLFEDEKIVVDIDPIDVAKMMILFKIARSNGDKDKLDNYVDMIGYAACAAEIFEGQEKRIEVFPCDHIKVAEECRVCNYREKCMGTGVCLKEKEKKCLLDQKDPYSYAHNKLHNYVLVKAKEEYIPLKKLNDIISKFTNYLDQAATDCVANGKRFLDCYKEIDEMFEKYKSNDKDECDNAVAEAISAYVPNGAIKIHKFVDDNRLNMDFDFEKSPKGRDRFNDVARAFIGGIGNSNVKITTFEAPKDWYLHDVFMNETGQIIVRFKEDEK